MSSVFASPTSGAEDTETAYVASALTAIATTARTSAHRAGRTANGPFHGPTSTRSSDRESPVKAASTPASRRPVTPSARMPIIKPTEGMPAATGQRPRASTCPIQVPSRSTPASPPPSRGVVTTEPVPRTAPVTAPTMTTAMPATPPTPVVMAMTRRTNGSRMKPARLPSIASGRARVTRRAGSPATTARPQRCPVGRSSMVRPSRACVAVLMA